MNRLIFPNAESDRACFDARRQEMVAKLDHEAWICDHEPDLEEILTLSIELMPSTRLPCTIGVAVMLDGPDPIDFGDDDEPVGALLNHWAGVLNETAVDYWRELADAVDYDNIAKSSAPLRKMLQRQLSWPGRWTVRILFGHNHLTTQQILAGKE